MSVTATRLHGFTFCMIVFFIVASARTASLTVLFTCLSDECNVCYTGSSNRIFFSKNRKSQTRTLICFFAAAFLHGV
jgi:hypothetical protein